MVVRIKIPGAPPKGSGIQKKVPTPKVPVSAAKPKGFPHVAEPRIKPLKTRIYSKGVTQQDPGQFGDFGFGKTGMTGES